MLKMWWLSQLFIFNVSFLALKRSIWQRHWVMLSLTRVSAFHTWCLSNVIDIFLNGLHRWLPLSIVQFLLPALPELKKVIIHNFLSLSSASGLWALSFISAAIEHARVKGLEWKLRPAGISHVSSLGETLTTLGFAENACMSRAHHSQNTRLFRIHNFTQTKELSILSSP